MERELLESQGFVMVFAAMLGAIVGSFLNVCILRWPADQSVISPRSRCPGCGQPIAWFDNIPVLSWLLLRARCRHCKTKVSVQYPLVELAAAVLWAYMAYRGGLTLEAFRGAVFGTILIGIAMTDAREYIIPDEFTLGGLVIGLLFAVAGGWAGLGNAVLGAGLGFALLWLVGYVGTLVLKEDAMGGGDIKMMAMVGAFLGWQGVLLTIFLGALGGTLIFVPVTLLGQKKLVPFGIFLAIGAAATYLVGSEIIEWYRRYLTV